MQNTLERMSLKQFVILQSMTLPERVELFKTDSNAFTLNDSLASNRTEQWKHCLGLQPEDTLGPRLNYLGINENDLQFILGDFSEQAGEHVISPPWWDICEQVHNAPERFSEGDLPEATFLSKSDEEQIPFEHVFTTWISIATQRLRSEVHNIDEIIGEAILRKEQRGLLENLCTLARSTMLRQFNLFKISAYAGNDFVTGLFSSKPPNTVYKSTVFEICQNGYENFIRQKPALARLLATRVVFWVRTLGEFATNLEMDRAELEDMFNDGKPIGKLIKGGRGISDSHNGGRAVVVCAFDSGLKIVYKPRNMDVDVAWINIVNAFNENAAESLQLKSLKVLSKDIHGWMEFAERQPCNNKDEITEYYNRMGALLALVHALQGNDFHLENVVAQGAHPVAIDLETISVPEPLIDDDGLDKDVVLEQISKSVLRTLLLPAVMSMGGRREVVNLGAVGVEVDAGQGMKKHRKLININLDFQRWSTVEGEDPTIDLDNQSKVELADGTQVDPNSHRTDLAQGYHEAYKTISSEKETWLKADGPLATLGTAWVRVLNRATNIYYRLLLESCNDHLLSSGLQRWIHGERFLVNTISAGQTLGTKARDTRDAIISCEQDALLRGDVAYFISKGAGHTYYSPNSVSGEPETVTGAFLQNSAIEAANTQVAAMGESDLHLQTKLIESSYLTAQISVEKRLHGLVELETLDKPDTPPSQDEVNQWILSGLEELDSLAICQSGKINWIDLAIDLQTETARPGAMNASIYSGRGGMALLFERAYRHFADKRWLDLAKASIEYEVQFITRYSETASSAVFDLEGPTGMMSRPGFISASWAIGRHEGEGSYRELARTLLTKMNYRTIERDRSHDVIAGSAGYMLFAMHLSKQEAIPELDPLLHKLGDYLLKKTINVDGPGWDTSSGARPLNGFGHGRAGIGLALLQAGTHLNRSDMRELGLAALKAEHEMKSEDPENMCWPDLRGIGIHEEIPKGPQMCAWCAGAEGIALGRAAALEFSDETFLQDDLDYALACMKAVPPKPRLHLCCGESGKTETYRVIQKLCGTDLSNEITDSFSHFFANASNGLVCENSLLMGMSLFQGVAGSLWSGLSEVMNDDGSQLLLLRT